MSLTINYDELYNLTEKAIEYCIDGSNRYNNSVTYKCITIYITTKDDEKFIDIKYEKYGVVVPLFSKRGFLKTETEYVIAISETIAWMCAFVTEAEAKAITHVTTDFNITAEKKQLYSDITGDASQGGSEGNTGGNTEGNTGGEGVSTSASGTAPSGGSETPITASSTITASETITNTAGGTITA